MSFREEAVPDFLRLFDERKELIREFQGCHHLELWQDATQKHVFFTYSIWRDEESLHHYRFSEFFRDTWGQTKILFDKKPQAFSLIQKVVL